MKSFAPSLKFTNPNAVCWTKDGFLVVVEHNRVLNFPAAEFFYEGPDVAVIEVVAKGGLIPSKRSRSIMGREPAEWVPMECCTSPLASLITFNQGQDRPLRKNWYWWNRSYERVRR